MHFFFGHKFRRRGRIVFTLSVSCQGSVIASEFFKTSVHLVGGVIWHRYRYDKNLVHRYISLNFLASLVFITSKGNKLYSISKLCIDVAVTYAGGKTQLAARLLGMWVWLLPGGECYVLSNEVFCDGPIPRPEKSYRILFAYICVCVCVCGCVCVCACACVRVCVCVSEWVSEWVSVTECDQILQ